jgi:excisionase family DNA binding protein
MRRREELDTDPYLLTVREAADELHMSSRLLKRLIRNGTGPEAITVGDAFMRIRRADLDAYKAQRMVAA